MQAVFDSVNSAADDIKSNGVGLDTIQNLAPFFTQLLQQNDITRSTVIASTGRVVNPMLDMVYSSPAFRTFRFDFMFYPRSQSEAKQVNEIIRKLKFYQAPEYDSSGQAYFLVPPSEFDIKFYCNGVENVNIPKISTCVLKSIDVDYAPNGWSAYETNNNAPSDGGTGMPVAIRMGLQFTETEILTKNVLPKDSDEGFYGFGGLDIDVGNVS